MVTSRTPSPVLMTPILSTDRAPGSRRQRRQSRRERQAPVGVELIDDNGEAIPFECFDLSAVGIYLHTDFLLCPGDQIRLRLWLESRPRSLDVLGLVVRAETGEEGLKPGIGIAFREMAMLDRAELERFLMRRFFGRG